MAKPSGPTSPRQPTVKRLFALSGNRCAFPDCPTRLVDQDTGTILGEICHIKGEKPTAARYDPDQDNEARHGFDNLILMCRNHHKIIDDNPEKYTVADLVEMKDVIAGYIPGVDILTGVNLTLSEGELVGIIGPNGAGKSTLVKAMFGLVGIRSGVVTLREEVITDLPAHTLVAKGVGDCHRYGAEDYQSNLPDSAFPPSGTPMHDGMKFVLERTRKKING